MKACCVAGCMRKHYAQGRCRNHYRQAKKRGEITNLTPKSVRQRFEEKFRHGGPDECWPWFGASSERNGIMRGEFQMNLNGRRVNQPAYRASYRLYVTEEIPPGYEIDHLCNNPICVNPKHLEAVPPEVNRARYHATQTHCIRGHEFAETHDGYGCGVCRRETRRRLHQIEKDRRAS